MFKELVANIKVFASPKKSFKKKFSERHAARHKYETIRHHHSLNNYIENKMHYQVTTF